ncbi:GNAT family N-acetyltransferase [Streptomyces silvensis]|uniref:GCN5 family acetyltransferase n=1 Tax=Streptomyces silvensis TaxID=1765722 RepID=A0A0W7X946_9ACTN|nr:GNAT family N-acetyltransferase [Streptomyces silvensis]KUF19138.1 GCN5 family acetyltransferase [Streptomyces silvensis]
MQATTLVPRTADLFDQGLEHRSGAALLRFGAARHRQDDPAGSPAGSSGSPAGVSGRPGWSGDGAVAWLDAGRGHLWSVGDAAAAAALVLRAEEELRGTVREFTGPRGVEAHVGEHFGLTDVVEWVFRWTLEEPPAMPGEQRVAPLGAEHHEELLAFLGAHSPAHSTGPGCADVSLWAGIRDTRGHLVACGALSRLRDSGAPLMASVATDTSQRGQGLGAALTAWLTRYAVREHGLCTLWQLAGNAPAQRLYDRLGYRDEDLCTSARITGR